jgi:hypothetical protein
MRRGAPGEGGEVISFLRVRVPRELGVGFISWVLLLLCALLGGSFVSSETCQRRILLARVFADTIALLEKREEKRGVL